MTKRFHKPTKEAEKRSISAPRALFSEAEQIMARRRIGNFSEYVRDLIRKDLALAETPERAEAA